MITCLEGYPTLAYALLATLVILVARYTATLATYGKAAHDESHQKTPPAVPHFLPFVGNLPWQFAWNPIEFFKSR